MFTPEREGFAYPAAAIAAGFTLSPVGAAGWGSPTLIQESKAGQRHSGKTNAEFLQRRAAGDRLGHLFGEFIELIVHISFHLVC
jgi:hypothetical protein